MFGYFYPLFIMLIHGKGKRTLSTKYVTRSENAAFCSRRTLLRGNADELVAIQQSVYRAISDMHSSPGLYVALCSDVAHRGVFFYAT